MKDRIDFFLVKSLLKKHLTEYSNGFKKGNFDVVGFIMKLVLVGAFIAIFVIFYGRFAEIYMAIRMNGVADSSARLTELLTITYTVILIFMTVGGVSKISRVIFGADDIKIFAAMPVGAKSLYIAKLIVIYLGQVVFALLTVIPVNATVLLHVPHIRSFALTTALMCILLPLISIAFASLFALPFNAVKRFLKSRFLLNFLIVTLITALLFSLFAVVLTSVKDLLLGDDIKYFFNERVMNALHVLNYSLYPGKWLADFTLGNERFVSGAGIVTLLLLCIILSMVIIRKMMVRVLQSRNAGDENFIRAKHKISRRSGSFSALVKKEFLQIFRTPSYMFSYFSVAVVMPIMVYFCMSVSSSLIVKLIGINCNTELAIFLTFLYGMLTNMFCATNISREGPMFYSVKAMPVSYKSVFFSKVFLCMIVAVLSQAISVAVLYLTKFVSIDVAVFVFASGVLFSFAQVCIATRLDFNHPHFFQDEDGEAKESSSTASAIIIISLLASFITGGAVLFIKMSSALREFSGEYLTYVIVGAVSVCAAVLSYFYMMYKLDKKYYEFSGGGLL